jgi:hypothetical protein
MRDGNGRTARMLYEYIIRRHLGDDSRFRNIPMTTREDGEPTLHWVFQDINGEIQSRDYPNIPGLDGSLLSEKLVDFNIDRIMNDQILVRFTRNIRSLIDNIPVYMNLNSSQEAIKIVAEIKDELNQLDRNVTYFDFENLISRYGRQLLKFRNSDDIVSFSSDAIPYSQGLDSSELTYDAVFDTLGPDGNLMQIGLFIANSHIKLVEIRPAQNSYRVLAIIDGVENI